LRDWQRRPAPEGRDGFNLVVGFKGVGASQARDSTLGGTGQSVDFPLRLKGPFTESYWTISRVSKVREVLAARGFLGILSQENWRSRQNCHPMRFQWHGLATRIKCRLSLQMYFWR
jgi:hypothetical protein